MEPERGNYKEAVATMINCALNLLNYVQMLKAIAYVIGNLWQYTLTALEAMKA